jgi:hypothetical protein
VNRRWTAIALVGAVGAGAVAAVALRGDTAPAVVARPPSMSTATIVRTNLDSTALTGGTLGYAPINPVVNQLSGTYTQLAPAGTSVPAGGTLYRVDDQPVALMAGTTPAWRGFAPGMTNGPDVFELETNLIALGHAHGLLDTPSDQFTVATTDAVERWQAATGQPATGLVALGQVVFLPAPLLVGAPTVTVGQRAAPGDQPFAVSSAQRTVTVPLDPNAPPATVGEAVTILLADGTHNPGTVTAIGPAPPSGDGNGNSGSNGGGSGSSPTAATQATVTPSDPAVTGTGMGVAVQVSLTVQSARHVLAAPISALLALAEGGYGVEVVGPSGTHHLIGVTTGLFTSTLVQVSGAGIHDGTKVVVAQ